MPIKGTARNRDTAKVWTIPYGPEDTDFKPRMLFHGSMDEALEFYEAARQGHIMTSAVHALLVTNFAGDPIFACS